MVCNNKLNLYHSFRMATFIITYQCPISCPMCFFACGPNRREVLPKDIALNALKEIKNFDIPVLGIAGGEPFTQINYLQDLIYKATSYDMATIVVTNAYWAASEDIAVKILTDLKKAGLNRLQISLDDQHQKFIKMEYVANAVKAARYLDFEDVMLLGTSKGNSEKFKFQLFYLSKFLNINIDDIYPIDRPRSSNRYFKDDDQIRYSFSDLERADDLDLPVGRPTDCLSEMMIDVNGDIYPCCNNLIGKIGNIDKNNITDVNYRIVIGVNYVYEYSRRRNLSIY